MRKLGRLLRKKRAQTNNPSPEETTNKDKEGGGPVRSPVIVGLGNPGRSYERTRHNVGFLVADELARRHGGRQSDWRKKKRSFAVPVNIGAFPAELLKPQTFMNNSGRAVGGQRVQDLVVIHDDLDLPEGDVRGKGRRWGWWSQWPALDHRATRQRLRPGTHRGWASTGAHDRHRLRAG